MVLWDSTRVSNELGGRRAKAAILAGRVAMGMVATEGAIAAIIIIIGRRLWGYCYSTDEVVVGYLAQILFLLAIVHIFDGIQSIFSGLTSSYKLHNLFNLYNLIIAFYSNIAFHLTILFHFCFVKTKTLSKPWCSLRPTHVIYTTLAYTHLWLTITPSLFGKCIVQLTKSTTKIFRYKLKVQNLILKNVLIYDN